MEFQTAYACASCQALRHTLADLVICQTCSVATRLELSFPEHWACKEMYNGLYYRSKNGGASATETLAQYKSLDKLKKAQRLQQYLADHSLILDIEFCTCHEVLGVLSQSLLCLVQVSSNMCRCHFLTAPCQEVGGFLLAFYDSD